VAVEQAGPGRDVEVADLRVSGLGLGACDLVPFSVCEDPAVTTKERPT
jgi:hypothetical protein